MCPARQQLDLHFIGNRRRAPVFLSAPGSSVADVSTAQHRAAPREGEVGTGWYAEEEEWAEGGPCS
eukprot:1720359-Rhodomonas_salina.2